MAKKKVLWLSDFNSATGLATAAHNIMEQLLRCGQYDFDVIGINHLGEPYDFTRWPFPIYPARDLANAGKSPWYDDPFGRPRFLEMLGSGKYDIAFTMPDTFIMELIADRVRVLRRKLNFKWIFYYAVDGKVKDRWINNCVALADVAVAYTNFGRDETRRVNPALNPLVIYMGVNTADFYPLKNVSEFRRAYFKEQAGKFIVTNVNRNQPRKDIPRTIAAFARFRRLRPDSLLYLHMSPVDAGGNVIEMADFWGLRRDVDYMVPENFNTFHGFEKNILNKIYNSSDVLVSTSLGEGWGLTVTEAMAAKTPVIIPDNSALGEIGADGRARLVKSGLDNTCLGAIDANQYRPLTDIDDLVAALIDCHDNREKYRQMAEKAYSWITGLSWDKIAPQWLDVFASAAKQSDREVKHIKGVEEGAPG